MDLLKKQQSKINRKIFKMALAKYVYNIYYIIDFSLKSYCHN